MNHSLRNRILLASYLHHWQLEARGEAVFTAHSALSFVTFRGRPAVLKVTQEPEELTGLALMEWREGVGCCCILKRHGPAVLLPAADETPSLAGMSCNGQDGEATRIICETIRVLHSPRPAPPPPLPRLDHLFAPLLAARTSSSGLESTCAAVARDLLQSADTLVPLHGDIHHGNIMWFANRGWAALDAKGILGPRGFEYANLFCNPPLASSEAFARCVLANFDARLNSVSSHACMATGLLLRWIAAWCGLSAWWMREDGLDPWRPLMVADQAVQRLGRNIGRLS